MPFDQSVYLFQRMIVKFKPLQNLSTHLSADLRMLIKNISAAIRLFHDWFSKVMEKHGQPQYRIRLDIF